MRLKLVRCFPLLLTLLPIILIWLMFHISKELGDCKLKAQLAQDEVKKTCIAAQAYQAPTSTSDSKLILGTAEGHRERVLEAQSKAPSFDKKNTLIRTASLTVSAVCHTPKCIALHESSQYGNTSPDRIPKIRHILWKNDKVSSYMARQLKTWQDIHPNWTYVLWRDSDLEKFVAKHYTGALVKFRSLKVHIMKIDMIRHMILHKYGGVYADLDYVLVRPLDRFLKFPAIVTRETEAHAFYHFGMGKYPPSILANPAFMMSEPGHPFYMYVILQLNCRGAGHFNQFAGPPALSDLLNQYAKDFPLSENPDGVVIVPASRNFYGFDNNNFASSTSIYKGDITGRLNSLCNDLKKSTNVVKDLVAYCKDVSNLDPITDKSEVAYAIHDYNKSRSSYDPAGSAAFDENQVDIRGIFPHLLMADTIF